ncbi:isochorismatase family protein [Patescibacteria group bacterium]
MIIVDGVMYERNQVAAIDVDALKCFTEDCPDELPVPGGNDIIVELNKQAMLADLRIASKEAHTKGAVHEATEDEPQFTLVTGYPNVDQKWNQHGVPGTKGFEFIDGLRMEMYDMVIYKGVEIDMHPYGICYHDYDKKIHTGVIPALRGANKRVAIVGGLALNYCVKETVMELLDADFVVVVNLGACRGLGDTTEAVNEMKNAGAFFVDTCKKLKV